MEQNEQQKAKICRTGYHHKGRQSSREKKEREARKTTIKQWDRHRVELLDDGQGKNIKYRSKQRVHGGSRREGDTGPRARREGTKEHAADSLHDPECRAEADISIDSGCHPVKHLGDAVLEKCRCRYRNCVW